MTPADIRALADVHEALYVIRNHAAAICASVRCDAFGEIPAELREAMDMLSDRIDRLDRIVEAS